MDKVIELEMAGFEKGLYVPTGCTGRVLISQVCGLEFLSNGPEGNCWRVFLKNGNFYYVTKECWSRTYKEKINS